MNDHPHSHDDHRKPEAGTPVDVGSHALAEALHSSFTIVKYVMIALVIVFLGSGFFKVESNEQAIKLRFGKPVGQGQNALLGSGLHWSFPYPIDEVVSVRVTDVQSIRSSVGWFAITPEQELAGTEPWAGPSLNPAIDGYVLTADGNIVHARATMLFRINDPLQYVFSFVNASNVVQAALDNALLYASANYKVDDILTRDKFGFQEAVRKRAAELLEQRNVGVAVERCEVETRPPRQPNVRNAFYNVLNAEIARNKLLNDARSHENQVLSKAGADAASLTNSAQAARVLMVNNAASEAQWFKGLLPEYQANPRLFVEYRLNLTLGRAFAKTEKFVQPGSGAGKNTVNWILLNRETPKPAATNTNQP